MWRWADTVKVVLDLRLQSSELRLRLLDEAESFGTLRGEIADLAVELLQARQLLAKHGVGSTGLSVSWAGVGDGIGGNVEGLAW